MEKDRYASKNKMECWNIGILEKPIQEDCMVA
jgi:hypothetical protein